jgi:hypothetical protein
MSARADQQSSFALTQSADSGAMRGRKLNNQHTFFIVFHILETMVGLNRHRTQSPLTGQDKRPVSSTIMPSRAADAWFPELLIFIWSIRKVGKYSSATKPRARGHFLFRQVIMVS